MGKEIRNTYTFSSSSLLVLGINDSNIPFLENVLSSPLYVKGNEVLIEKPNPLFIPLFEHLEDTAEESGILKEEDIFRENEYVKNSLFDSPLDERITILSRSVYPKSKAQNDFIKAMRDESVIFSSGPAGCGKTFLSVSFALEEVLSGKRNKIILTRPVLEAGESLGYLPGDLKEKLDPFLRPFYDAMEYFLSPKEIKRMEDDLTLEISPLAYMRGRTFNNAIAILDEGQNTTPSQMKMFLTRLGEGSKAIVLGDPSQSDLLSSSSGLNDAISHLDGRDGIKVVYFTHHDTFRSRIVRSILKAYGDDDGK